MTSTQVANRFGKTLVGDLIAGLDYATEQIVKSRRPAVVHMSFNKLRNEMLDEAVGRAVAAGVPVVVAAGDANDDACLFSPAGARVTATVAATDRLDR